MSVVFWILDIFACWLLFYMAGAFLAVSAVQTPRQVAVVLGLIVVLVCSFVGGIVIWETGPRTWWATGIRLGGATVAIGVYDRQFGIRRHLRMVASWAACLWRRVGERFS